MSDTKPQAYCNRCISAMFPQDLSVIRIRALGIMEVILCQRCRKKVAIFKILKEGEEF